MSNPILSDKNFKRSVQQFPPPQVGHGAGWGAPQVPGAPGGPITDGPVSTWQAGVMTMRGTLTATAVLFALLLAAAVGGWLAVDPDPAGEVSFPPLAVVGMLVGFGCVIASYFKPRLAKFLGPVYAIAEGFFVGTISHYYDLAYDGIVVQAAGATIAVFAVMLMLYRTQIIKVTDRFRRIVVGATLGIMVFYGISLLMRLFGAEISFLSSSNGSMFGIGFSVFVCALAAFNLALDFDFIERGTKAQLPKDMEWVAALGLVVTIVWLYLEILRLLARLRNQ